MNKFKFAYLLWGLSLLFFLTDNVLLGQVSFNVNGSWNYYLASNLEAGNDFEGTYRSDETQVYLATTTTKGKGNAGNFNWNISIHKEDINWDASLRIFARRTGNGVSTSNGNEGGLIQGGTNFLELTSGVSYFFSGKKGRVDIPIQYQIDNVSVLIPAENYSTTIIFTMTEE